MASSLQDSVTRNRSNSGEDCGLPEHDRKRPRLSEGKSDAEQPLPDLNGSPHQKEQSNPPLTTPDSPDIPPRPALPPRSPDISMANSSPTSKVTINTRPLSSQSMSNNAAVAADGAVDRTETADADDHPAETVAQGSNSKPIPVTAPETISISSSPTGSPEIEIAEVEEYDQDPAETKWTRRVGASGVTRSILPSDIRSSFPFAKGYKPGEARQAVNRITNIFRDPQKDPGPVFQAVKQWLVTFAATCDSLTEEIIEEESGFWYRLYQIPETLLKRDQQTNTSVGCQDLIDFFVAYGQLTKLMFELETRRCAQIAAGNDMIQKVLAAAPWFYLTPITWILTKNCTLLNSLQKHHGLDPMLIIQPCYQQLMSGNEINLMQSVNDLITALGSTLIKASNFFQNPSVLTSPLGNLLDLLNLTSESFVVIYPDTSATVENFKESMEKAYFGVDKLLQDSVRKQSPWLTAELGIEITSRTWQMFSKLGAEIPRFGRDLIKGAGVVVDDADYTYLETIVGYAWRFKMYHKFLRHGRMELRVAGVERMCSELVEVFRSYIQNNMHGLHDPLVKFLNRFLRENDIIPYVISVDSHPQIVQRSPNLVGFLSVSHTYTTSDTETIWRAITEGQDSRTVQEILNLVQRCFDTFQEAETNQFCQKLVELPYHEIDNRLLDFAIVACNAISKKPQNSLSQYFNAPPVYDPVCRKLCLRLLRFVSSPSLQPEYWNLCQMDLIKYLTQFLHASREVDRCLAISEEEENSILSDIKEDIESQSEASAGAIVALNCILSMKSLDLDAKLSVVDRCGLPQTLIHGLPALWSRMPTVANYPHLYYIDPPLVCLSFLLTHVPERLDDALLSTLWTSLLTGQTVNPQIRLRAWGHLTTIMKQSRQPNSAIDHILRDYWSKIQPSDFSKAVLDFAEQSIAYQSETSDQPVSADGEIVVIPGIERVWTIMLDAPSGTLETEATDFVINQYLHNPRIRRTTKSSQNATHLDLIDRCVHLVLGSAAKLKSFAETEGQSDGDDSMVIIATPNEIRVEELRFDRSLLFLRRFTEAVKGNPGCSPISSRQLNGLPEFPGKRGESIEFKVQVFGNKYVNDTQRSVTVGSANTGSELWEYLSNISGFSSFTVINDGKARADLQNETSTLEQLKIFRGALIVNKTVDTVEQIPSTRLRACSPVDEKISLHFDDLYGLLESDDRLAKEVYDFLNITTVREKVSQLARSMQTPAADFLSTGKPYKLLFCTQALRSPVEFESFSNEPDAQFLSYAVHAIATAFKKLSQAGHAGILQKSIAYDLIDTLMIAFRAKVSPEASKKYLGSLENFPELILKYLDAILQANDVESQQLHPEKMTRASFEILLEARLQNEASWKTLDADPNLIIVLRRALLSTSREAVRKSILDVLISLTGATGSAPTPKSSPKVSDPRAARARYDASVIESCSKRVWELLLEILPSANQYQTQCHHFFEAVLVILQRIGTTLEVTALQSFFDQWTEALLGQENHEIVGQPTKDQFIPGTVNVIHECAKLLIVKEALPPQSKLMRKLISELLFPPLSEAESGAHTQYPALDSKVRESLYELLIRICQDPSEVYTMALELSDDLVAPQLFQPNLAHERLALRSEIGYAGLKNLSNTCYLNSLFSQLFMNVQFRELILRMSIVDAKQQSLLWEMAKVFAHMQDSYDKSIEPTGAVDSIVTYDGENIDVTVQMDVDEFFNLLFDRLEGQILDQNAKSRFKSLYGGQAIQQIKSKECEHVSERPDPFAVLPVEIKEKFRLEDSLKAYVEGELLQGDNKYSCTSCGRMVDAVKRSCLKEVPDNLILGLKRFDYDLTTGLRCKLNDHFAFPETLDVAPYTLEHLSRPDQPIRPDTFELTGIIVHSGTADSGHYFSYIRQRPCARDKQSSWVQFNDSDVASFDPALIQDNCFGGADATWNNLPKFYSAYMLFYQRTSSIQGMEQQFKHADPLNPIRLENPSPIQQYIEKENELFLRSYCAQDPVHAKFVRKLLERLWETGQEQCTEGHEVEDRTLQLALSYVHNISSRWKNQPEMDGTVKLIHKHCQRCTTCALTVLQFLAGDQVIVESLVKSPYQATRKAFSYMLRSSLSALHPMVIGDRGTEVAQLYYANLVTVVRHLARAWELVARTSRAWTEYFGLLADLVDLGVEEARLVLDEDFIEYCSELIHVHFIEKHDFRADVKLKQRYASYLSARERNRPFNHYVLMHFFARMVFRLDLTIWPNGDDRVLQAGSEQMGPTPTELDYLGLSGSPYNLEWLKRIIAGHTAPAVADGIVGYLASARPLAGAVSHILVQGLDHKSMPVAAAFLQPTVMFCTTCGNLNQIVDLVVKFAESVPTIGLEYGKEYCLTVKSLLRAENKGLGLESGFLRDVLAEQMHQWAPVLLVADSDVAVDVRGDALDIVNVLLLDRLEAVQGEDPSEYRVFQARALQLAKQAADYVQSTILNSNSNESHNLQPGHANQVMQAVDRCLGSAELDNVEDEQLVEEIQRVMVELKGKADQAVETLSTAEWQESSEMDALSEDFEDLV